MKKPRTESVAATFEETRASFERAWQALSARCSEVDYQAQRDQREWTAWKYRMHDAALQLPTQLPDGFARCFCGEIATMAGHVIATRLGHWRAVTCVNAPAGRAPAQMTSQCPLCP